MAIYDIGMTMEEVQASGEMEAPPDGDYRFRFEGLLKKDGSPIFEAFGGGQTVLAKFMVVSAEPSLAGKGIIYKGKLGNYKFSNLAKVIPGLMTQQGLDDEAGIGTEVAFTVTHGTFTADDGEVKETVKVSKMRSVA